MRLTKRWRNIVLTLAISIGIGALLVGVLELMNALGADLLATWLRIGFGGLLIGAIIAGYFVRFVVRARGYDANAGLAFFLPLDRYEKVSDDEARVRWSKAFSLPPGGTLTQAWDVPDMDLTRIHCRDAAGEVYWLLDGPPTLLGPSAHWVAGLFLRAESDELGGRRRRSVRLFERLSCRWQPRTEEDDADDLRRLGGERLPDHLSSWQCKDCQAIRLDFQSSDGRVLMVFRNIPVVAQPAYIAGMFFHFGRTLYPRSTAWSGPPPGEALGKSSSPAPKNQPA